MINIKKVAYQLKYDGMYNTVYIEVQEALNNEDPSLEEIQDLITKDEYYIWEYKELNRYGELSSVHAKTLDIGDNEEDEVKNFKEKLNADVQELRNMENFEVDSRNSAYSIWIGSIGVMVIFMAHNIIALFSELYATHSDIVYGTYAVILAATYWGYKKVKINHEKKHQAYKILHANTRQMIKKGLENKYFSYDEFYEAR